MQFSALRATVLQQTSGIGSVSVRNLFGDRTRAEFEQSDKSSALALLAAPHEQNKTERNLHQRPR